ncbi:MAG: glycosyltransferase family 39 protein [Betaproteobacteria bacterium]
MILGANRLRYEPLTAYIERRPGVIAATLCALWMIPGLIGRDPWKPDEAFVFGVVYQMILSGDWSVPALAGETYLRNPPFYYLSAALVGKMLSPLLPLHDAVRLVNALFGALTFGLLAMAAQVLNGAGRGWIAPLLLLGSVGLVFPAHLLVPDNALLTAFAAALYGLAIIPRFPARGGLVVGTGIGLAFMSKGLAGSAALLLGFGLMPVMAPHMRNRATLVAAAAALGAAVPWLAIWPATLYFSAPHLFAEWFAADLGRYFGVESLLSDRGNPLYYLGVIPWFAWPVLPFAAWTLWHARRNLTEPAIIVPLTIFGAALLVLSGSHERREILALPLLAPLTLLAVPRIKTVPRGGQYAFFWFSIVFFLFFIAAVWFYWLAVEFGVPARLAAHMAAMEPGYEPVLSIPLMVVAALLTVAWVVFMFNVRRSPERPLLAWTAGGTAFWAVLMTLLIAFVDNAKSYRDMIDSLVAALPAKRGCIVSVSLGESQRALLHYFAGITTLRVEAGHAPQSCDLLFIEGTVDRGRMTSPWTLMWEGHRAGDGRERYRLYRDSGVTDAGREQP